MAEVTAAAASGPPRAPGRGAGTGPGSGGAGPWLHGPASDLLLGYGLLYLLLVPALAWGSARLGGADWPMGVAALLALAFSTPHYGATLLRVYERRSDRERYAFFAVWLTAFMALCFGLGLYDVAFGGLLLTLYVCWSPWHFAGQNFGVALMSLRRRGVVVDARTRRLLHGSFVLSFVLSLLGIHTLGSSLVFAQGTGDESVYSVLRLGLAPPVALALGAALGSVWLGFAAGALVRIARAGGVGAAVPAALLVATHSLWFVLPAVGRITGGLPLPSLVFSAVSISAAHSIQYLWITSYYARRSDAAASHARFYGKCLLAGTALAVTPALLFAPGLLGRATPLVGGVPVLVFVVVNLHHFVLDGAVWKLRDGRVARALLGTGGAGESVDRPGRGWVRPAVFALGALGLCFPLYLFVELRTAFGSDDPAAMERSIERLGFFGKHDARLWGALGAAHEREGDPEAAIAAYREAYALDPARPGPASRLSVLLVEHAAGEPGTIDLALEAARSAATATGQQDPMSVYALAAANDAAGRPRAARRAYQLALALARRSGDRQLAQLSARALAR